MIVLDTHVWVWLVDNDPRLSVSHKEYIQQNTEQELGVSIISCWEVAKLVEYHRLLFSCSLEEWIYEALYYPGICLLDLTPRITIESTQLPSPFHRDPADQLIVATARVLDCPLVTADTKILNYPHVKTYQGSVSE